MRRLSSRRAFIATAGLGTTSLILGPRPAFQVDRGQAAHTSFPHQDPRLVHDFVRLSHFDEDAVRELVTDRPALARASWDWGFGDWESGLGAASHVGRKDIAELLLAHNARPNLFTFAMLGKVDAVRAMVEARPGVQRTTGPHGLSLLHHARAGGDEAVSVVAYLEELGDADPQPIDLPLDDHQRRAYLGTYHLSGNNAEVFRIIEQRGHVAFQYGEEAARRLLHQGAHEFHPVGVPEVLFRFDPQDDNARNLTIHDGEMILVATRAS